MDIENYNYIGHDSNKSLNGYLNEYDEKVIINSMLWADACPDEFKNCDYKHDKCIDVEHKDICRECWINALNLSKEE